VSALFLNLIVVAGVAVLDAAFVPAAVIVLAGLWTFWSIDRRDPIPD
jgi:hypothetical protein